MDFAYSIAAAESGWHASVMVPSTPAVGGWSRPSFTPVWSPRPSWAGAPVVVTRWAESVLGSSVAGFVDRTGGFSAGFASVLTGSQGERIFVKAVDARLNPRAVELHRAEIRAAPWLQGCPSAPQLLSYFDDGTWVALAFSAIDGDPPPWPWRADNILAAVTGLARLHSALTDRFFLGAPLAVDVLYNDVRAWSRLVHRAADVAALDPWLAERIPELSDLAVRAPLSGSTLLNLDVRADNIVFGRTTGAHCSGGTGSLASGAHTRPSGERHGDDGAGHLAGGARRHPAGMRHSDDEAGLLAGGDRRDPAGQRHSDDEAGLLPGGARRRPAGVHRSDEGASLPASASGGQSAEEPWFVDWSWAALGNPLVDVVVLLVNVAVSGSDPQLWLERSASAGAASADVAAVLAVLTGHWAESCLQSEPVGVAGMRSFQRAHLTAASAWLRRCLVSAGLAES